MSSLIPFSFESSSLRFIPNGDSFSVVAKDVLLALEYTDATISNIGDAIKHVPGEWKGRVPIPTPGGTQDMLTLTEQGFYFFVNRSDKPKALPLQKWVAGEVLPSIRQTGSYSLPGASGPTDALAAQLAELLKGKVLVDYHDLRNVIGGALAARNVLDSLEVLAQRIEAQCGQPLIDGLTKPQPAPAPLNSQVVPRQPVRQPVAVSALERVEQIIEDAGAGGITLCELYAQTRFLTKLERDAVRRDLRRQGRIIERREPAAGNGSRSVVRIQVATLAGQGVSA